VRLDGVAIAGCTLAQHLVSPDGDGTSPNVTFIAMSGDGQWVAWTASFGGVRAWNHVTGETRVINTAFDGGPADGGTQFLGGMSYDGRYVLFLSDASNLLAPGKDTNGNADAFVRRSELGVTSA
jgi:hypothetical protein